MTDMNTPQLIIVQDREAALRAQLGQALGRLVAQVAAKEECLALLRQAASDHDGLAVENERLKVEVARLKAEGQGQRWVIEKAQVTQAENLATIRALRQPCDHQGREPDCPWCRVRAVFINFVSEWFSGDIPPMVSWSLVLKRFDAACQAVREGQ